MDLRPSLFRRVIPYGIALVTAAFLIPSASAQTAQAALSISQGQLQPAAALPCEQGTDFCVEPSFDTQDNDQTGKCLASKQIKTLALVGFCYNLYTGAILPYCNIQITAMAVPNTGGHLHTDPGRPAGAPGGDAFSPSSGNTGASGLLPTTYNASEVSGVIQATITGTLSDGTPVAPGYATIGVELDGLSAVPGSGAGYTTTVSVGHDHNNIYMNPSAGTDLTNIPVDFDNVVAPLVTQGVISEIPTLVFTSMSLPYGGLFDVDAYGTGSITHPWSPPHCGHRRGIEADLRINNIPPELRNQLATTILLNNFRMPVRSESPSYPNATHWHLRAR